uniref:Chromosome 11 open reading frame 16 n=1 Tax=Prolemur simus TaxID=1328070 RepID=A0A8C9AFV2_PROSS
MESSTGLGMPLPKYCSVATTLKAPCWDHAAPLWDLSFTCPFALRAPWLTRHQPPTRCASYHPCLHRADPAWQGPGWLGRAGDAADIRVLARREPDGCYYRAQLKAAPELERQGTLLVEYEAPRVTGPKLPARQQSVVLEEDVVRLSPSVGYALHLGDKVLAPWEPDRQRYGPGTVVLGLEARDPQRASKEEEITVHFWNGRTAEVPLGEVQWVTPTVWKKAVERLHKPFTREHPSPLCRAPCCSLLGPATGCIARGLPLGTPTLCPPCHPHTCCQLRQGCLCCCPSAGLTWWPLPRTSEVTARELPESELRPTAQLLPLEGPKEEEVAVPAPVALSFSSSSSSSTSSSEEEDLENDLEMGLPQKLMANSAVNTDPILLEKSLRQSGLCRPEWRYWRRNGPEPRPGKPGTRRCNIRKKEKDNRQERVQTVGVGTPKELATKATNMKLPQTLPEQAEHRKLSQGNVTRQRAKNS